MMSIDWSATGDMLGGIAAVLQTIAILYVAKTGQNVIADWQNQRKFDRRFDAADKLALVLEEMDHAIDGVFVARGMPPFRSAEDQEILIQHAKPNIDRACDRLLALLPSIGARLNRGLSTKCSFLLSNARNIVPELLSMCHRYSDDDAKLDSVLWDHLQSEGGGNGNLPSYRYLYKKIRAELAQVFSDNNPDEETP